jgi:hypothetical protein
VRRFLVWAISAGLRPKALLVAGNLCLRQQLGCCSAGTPGRACAMRTGGSGFAPVDGSLVGASSETTIQLGSKRDPS